MALIPTPGELQLDDREVGSIQQGRLSGMCCLAAAVMICYDYCLGLELEIRYIWGSRPLGSAALYCIVRYSGLVCGIMLAYIELSVVDSEVAMPSWVFPSASRNVFTIVLVLLLELLLITTAIFSGLRVYAVSDRSTWVLASVVFLNVLSPAVYVASFAVCRQAYASVWGGSNNFPYSELFTALEKWHLGAQVCAIVADIFVLAITWMHMWPPHQTQGMVKSETSTLADVIRRDGTLFFGVLLATNLVGITFLRAPRFLTAHSSFLSGFSSVLTSRFILDLREANERLSGLETSRFTLEGITTLSFRAPSTCRCGCESGRCTESCAQAEEEDEETLRIGQEPTQLA